MDAEQLMTLDVTCIDRDTPINLAWEVMQRQRVRHLPVVDHGKLAGIVSDRDLLLRGARQLDGSVVFPDLCAAEVMSFHPVACGRDAEISEIAAKMVEQRFDSMPIVADDGELLGLVTSTDVLRIVAEGGPLNPRPYSVTVRMVAR